METFVKDIRFGLRTLTRNLAFTVVAVVTLGLGVGANTAIFSVVNGVLLTPLSYNDPHRLVFVWERNPSIGKDRDLVAPQNFQDWKKQNTVFEELGAYRAGAFTLTNADNPEQVAALTVSSSLFGVLGVGAAVGRTFTDDEELRRDLVVVLTHEFWQRRFGGDRTVVGRSITLSGASGIVIGVMPPSFRFPEGSPVDLYSPLAFSPAEFNSRRAHSLTVIGRLKDGVTIEGARANLGTIAQSIAAQDSTSNPEVSLVGVHDFLVEDVRLGLVILLGTTGFVLLIACANVANLLLARSDSRRREIAVRSALGASKLRLLRQLLTESVLLVVLGAVLGTLMAWWVLGLFVRFSPPDFARMDHVGIDTNVLFFVTAIAVLTGIVFGIAPSLHVSGSSLSATTKGNSGNVSAAFRRNRGRSLLVVGEIALSFVLLTGAGLMMRSFLNVQNLDLGFQPRDVLTAQILLPQSRYPLDPTQFRPSRSEGAPPPPSKPAVFVAGIMERLKALPEVQSAGAVTSLPLNPVGTDFDLPVVVQGKPPARVGEEQQADIRIATTDYFRTMQIPLLRGREFNAFDDLAGTSVVIINETMARQMFAGEDPLGQRLILYGRPREIVGVVGSVRHHGFSREARPEMTLPYGQMQVSSLTLVVRSSMEPSALATAITREVRAMDAELPVYRVQPMQQYLSNSIAQPRFTTLLLAAFAGLAITLASIGVYGVMSYAVSQRTQEIGMRMALGANRRDVVWMVVRQGMTLALLGVIVGLAGAATGARLMTGLLFGVTATDPATFVAAALALGVASLAATYVPARRATRVDPVNALRAE